MSHMLMIIQLYQGAHYKDQKLITNPAYPLLYILHTYKFCILYLWILVEYLTMSHMPTINFIKCPLQPKIDYKFCTT